MLSGLARASVSRYLAVARWPVQLIDAFQSPVSISVDAIGSLNPLLKDCRVSMLREAAAIVAERAADPGMVLTGPTVARRLLAAAKPGTTFQDEIRASDGTLVGHVQRRTRKTIVIELRVPANDNLAGLMTDIGDLALAQMGASANDETDFEDNEL